MRASAAATLPVSSTSSTSWCSRPISLRRRPARAQLRHAEADLAAQRAVQALQPGRADRRHKRLVERAVAGHHLAPAGVVGECLHAGDRLAGAARAATSRSSTARTTRHSSGMRTENRSRISSRVSTGMWALRLGSRTRGPRGRGSGSPRAPSGGRRRTRRRGRAPGGVRRLDLAVEDPSAQRDDHRLGGRDRPDGESAHQAATAAAARSARGSRRPARALGSPRVERVGDLGERDRANAQRARFVAAALGGGDVEHALQRRADCAAFRSGTTASNAAPNRYSAPGLSPRETATTRLPDRTASATASRAPRVGRAIATTRASDSSPLSSPR